MFLTAHLIFSMDIFRKYKLGTKKKTSSINCPVPRAARSSECTLLAFVQKLGFNERDAKKKYNFSCAQFCQQIQEAYQSPGTAKHKASNEHSGNGGYFSVLQQNDVLKRQSHTYHLTCTTYAKAPENQFIVTTPEMKSSLHTPTESRVTKAKRSLPSRSLSKRVEKMQTARKVC